MPLFSEVEFNIVTVILLGIALSAFSFPFFAHLFHSKKLTLIRTDRRFNTFFVSDFYKIPLRYVGFLFIYLMSFVRKNEKTYLHHLLKEEYESFRVNKELLVLLGKEIYYPYALFVFDTITYFQSVRYEKQNRKEDKNFYPGFLGFLALHTDSYQPLNEEKIWAIEYARFDMGTWIPRKSEEEFINLEPARFHNYRENLEFLKEKELSYELSQGLSNLEVETRIPTKRTKIRFDSNKEK